MDMDQHDGIPAARSALMSRVRGKNTAPEMLVRREVHRQGRRFRLHRRSLPGSPDLVFPARRQAIFVHGCFWHRHEGCRKCSTPKTRRAFWEAKFAANIARDSRNLAALKELGWRTAVVWECETTDSDRLRTLIAHLLQ
jgi:DNA mismatch endonuclease (patch repair protein)